MNFDELHDVLRKLSKEVKTEFREGKDIDEKLSRIGEQIENLRQEVNKMAKRSKGAELTNEQRKEVFSRIDEIKDEIDEVKKEIEDAEKKVDQTSIELTKIEQDLDRDDDEGGDGLIVNE